jgi:hypothetical protein
MPAWLTNKGLSAKKSRVAQPCLGVPATVTRRGYEIEGLRNLSGDAGSEYSRHLQFRLWRRPICSSANLCERLSIHASTRSRSIHGSLCGTHERYVAKRSDLELERQRMLGSRLRHAIKSNGDRGNLQCTESGHYQCFRGGDRHFRGRQHEIVVRFGHGVPTSDHNNHISAKCNGRCSI